MIPDLWLDEHYSGEFFSGNLDHLIQIQKKANLFFETCKITTVAGTNGKGETARYFNQLLLHENYTTGLWTSPHLVTVNERFIFNGVKVVDTDLIMVFEEVKKLSISVQLNLSYFEFLFISFLLLAKKYQVDYLVLEVGLGGRLDAVNILDADIVLLTSISRDHTDLLGNRYDLILQEKLGVVRVGKTLISALELAYLREKVTKNLLNKKILWKDLFQEKALKLSDSYVLRNKIIAQAAFFSLFKRKSKYNLDLIYYGIRDSFERKGALFNLFPSHNVDGVRKLVQFLKQEQYTKYDKLIVSFSERELKDLNVMMQQLLLVFEPENIFLFSFDHYKAVSQQKLDIISEQYKIKIYFQTNYLPQVEAHTRYLVTGSNYFLGHMLKLNQLIR
jgi:dihydrofolate synthase/folylpolyglutamate synthase